MQNICTGERIQRPAADRGNAPRIRQLRRAGDATGSSVHRERHRGAADRVPVLIVETHGRLDRDEATHHARLQIPRGGDQLGRRAGDTCRGKCARESRRACEQRVHSRQCAERP